MSKNNEDTKLPEPEKIPTVEVKTNNTVIQENYAAMEYLSWFMSDAQNVQNWAGAIFRGGFDKSDPRFSNLKDAANKALNEIEDDITKMKEFLAQYTPNNA